MSFSSCAFRTHEIEALVTILTGVIGSPTFSLNKITKRPKPTFSRNFLTKCLMKYAYIQRKLAAQLIIEIVKQIPKRISVLVVLDDTLVKKCGKHIHGVYNWFDHSCGRNIASLCLVNVSLVVENQLLCVIPWVLRNPRIAHQSRGKLSKNQDAKTGAAIEMIQSFRLWLASEAVFDKQIVVVADSWYSNKTMQTFIKQTEMDFRLDARSNLSVQCPDHQAIARRGQRRQGRKRLKFVHYVPLMPFMGNLREQHFFTDLSSGERVFYRKAILTLKTAGRVTAYAFQRESLSKPKFILTRASRLKTPDPRTVYSHYQSRWRIEEAHRDLKQQFGLLKCQARHAWIVSGFIGLIYFGYSLWKSEGCLQCQTELEPLKCPSWVDEFHREQIQLEILAMA